MNKALLVGAAVLSGVAGVDAMRVEKPLTKAAWESVSELRKANCMFDAMCCAIDRNNSEAFSMIIAAGNLQKQAVSPLLYAVLNNDSDLVRKLCNKPDYDLNKEENYYTILQIAQENKLDDILTILITNKNWNVNGVVKMSNKISVCFLTRAVLDENVPLIKRFLTRSDLEIDNNAGIGKTPYCVAIFRALNPEISGLLKDHGAKH